MSDAPITLAEGEKLWEEGEAAYNSGDYDTAYLRFYGLYGAGITVQKTTQAALANAIGHSLRRLGRFTEAQSWFNEAMTAPGSDHDIQQKAAAGIRQARMENSGEAYDLDDDEPGGGISVDEGSRLWSDGEAAYNAGRYDEAYQLFYGLYGAGITVSTASQAAIANAIGHSLRRLGRFTEAESWFNEAMTAPGTDEAVKQKAAAGIRQARLENTGEAYDLDDSEPGGGIGVDEGSRLWTEGETAYNAGNYEAAYLSFYGLYGAGVTVQTHSQAALALAIGHSLRRLGRFTEAESWFNEAMSAPGTTAGVEQKAAEGIRQARLENSGEPYNLDD